MSAPCWNDGHIATLASEIATATTTTASTEITQKLDRSKEWNVVEREMNVSFGHDVAASVDAMKIGTAGVTTYLAGQISNLRLCPAMATPTSHPVGTTK